SRAAGRGRPKVSWQRRARTINFSGSNATMSSRRGPGVMVLHAVARFGESWRRSNRSTSTIGQRGAGPEADAGTFPLAPGLLLFVPVSLLGNLIGLVLRYPDIGSAVLFPPYAALTAALVV